MASATLRVRTSGRGETIFEVHHWPEPGPSFVCSSVCAHREPDVSLTTPWARPEDGPKIQQRLAEQAGATSGARKGRVLYVLERRPLGGGLRPAAAALTTVDGQTVKVFRLCFSAKTLRAQRPADASLLVSCARALAADGGRALHMLVPPRAAPGDIAAQFAFENGTLRDRFGQTWVR